MSYLTWIDAEGSIHRVEGDIETLRRLEEVFIFQAFRSFYEVRLVIVLPVKILAFA